MKYYHTILILLINVNLFAQSNIEVAEKAIMTKDYTTAIDYCTLILATDSGNTEASILLGTAYQGMQNYQLALEAYINAKDQEQKTLLYLKAECFENLGDIVTAENIYNSVLQNDTSDLHALRNVARISFKQKKFERAEIYFNKLLLNDPENYLYLKNIGICQYNLNREFIALDNLRRAWEINKRDLSLPISIANVYARFQEPHLSLGILNEGLKYDSTNIQILKTAAYIHYKLESFDSSVVCFAKALEYGDSTVFTRKYLGISLLNQAYFAESIPHLQSFYEDDTLNTEATYYLGLALSSWHKKREGIDLLKETIALMNPDSSFVGSVYGSIGQAWADINRCEESASNYGLAISYDPGHFSYYFEKAKMHDQMGKIENSREQYKSAIEYYDRYIALQTDAIEKIMEERGLEMDQVNAPGFEYARERIRKIKNELFFLGEEKK